MSQGTGGHPWLQTSTFLSSIGPPGSPRSTVGTQKYRAGRLQGDLSITGCTLNYNLALGSKENGSHVRWKTGQDRPKPSGPDCTQNHWAPLAPGSPLRLGPSVAFVPVQVRDTPCSMRSAAAPLPRAALRSLSSLLRYFSG